MGVSRCGGYGLSMWEGEGQIVAWAHVGFDVDL